MLQQTKLKVKKETRGMKSLPYKTKRLNKTVPLAIYNDCLKKVEKKIKDYIAVPLILLSTSVFSQDIRVNGLIDRTAHIVAEIEAIERNIYIKQSFEVAPNIEGGFLATGTALGLTTNFGMFEQYRLYGAPKITFIARGGEVYSSAGGEIGFDKEVSDGFFIGIRGTYDYRTDFQYWGGASAWQASGFIKIGFKIR